MDNKEAAAYHAFLTDTGQEHSLELRLAFTAGYLASEQDGIQELRRLLHVAMIPEKTAECLTS